MKKAEADTIRAAIAWWVSKRPAFWTETDHLAVPHIKDSFGSDEDKLLCKRVADLLMTRIKRQKRQAKPS